MPITVSINSNGSESIYTVQWPVKFISRSNLKSVYDFLWRCRTYGELSADRITDLQNKFRLSPEIISIVHRIVITQKSIFARSKINKDVVKREYATNDITDLAAKYDVPPLLLLRTILIESGYSSSALYGMYKTLEPEKYLHGRDLKQYYLAAENDITNAQHQKKVGEDAALAEKKFVEKFHGIGVSYKTQDDLVSEQVKQHGRAIITPDVLVTGILYINGKRIHWIDYKNYVLIPDTFIHKSVLEQAARYNREFGPGAIMFEYGCPHLNIPKTLIITGESFDEILKD